MSTPRRFQCRIDDAAIRDLHERLDRTRWPDQLDDVDWSYGTEKNYLQQLVQYWRHQFDWRAAERNINRLDQFLLDIDGLDIHFIHQRSPHANAAPLILCHGWPGSIVEFLNVIPRLTEPEKFGGRAEDAFHVVCPSLPGYGFSPAAPTSGMGPYRVAQRHTQLMAALGYDSYIAQGGDWGSMVTRYMADIAPQHCRAIHLNLVVADAPDAVADPLALCSAEERHALKEYSGTVADGFGYFRIQSTRPQTLAYALTDSPVGLCAWIAEKFYAWTDCRGDIRNAVSWDDLLTNIALYWFTGTIGSSVRLYKEFIQTGARGEPRLGRCAVPTGAAIYPREIQRPPKAWVEHQYNLVHWFKAERGGHFAALEQPEIFAEDLRRFKQAAWKC
jgi:epoxide hydrolase